MPKERVRLAIGQNELEDAVHGSRFVTFEGAESVATLRLDVRPPRPEVLSGHHPATTLEIRIEKVAVLGLLHEIGRIARTMGLSPPRDTETKS